jgi:hypothetical protein
MVLLVILVMTLGGHLGQLIAAGKAAPLDALEIESKKLIRITLIIRTGAQVGGGAWESFR